MRRETTATPQQVWAVLADGWTYAAWVVGASRIRIVDETFPDPGSRIHHSAGTWPLLLDDETVVLECQPERRLVLQAKGRPFGEARIDILIEPGGADGADAPGCTVQIREDVTNGPGRLVPLPLRQRGFEQRNVESLRRLLYLVERASR